MNNVFATSSSVLSAETLERQSGRKVVLLETGKKKNQNTGVGSSLKTAASVSATPQPPPSPPWQTPLILLDADPWGLNQYLLCEQEIWTTWEWKENKTAVRRSVRYREILPSSCRDACRKAVPPSHGQGEQRGQSHRGPGAGSEGSWVPSSPSLFLQLPGRCSPPARSTNKTPCLEKGDKNTHYKLQKRNQFVWFVLHVTLQVIALVLLVEIKIRA